MRIPACVIYAKILFIQANNWHVKGLVPVPESVPGLSFGHGARTIEELRVYNEFSMRIAAVAGFK